MVLEKVFLILCFVFLFLFPVSAQETEEVLVFDMGEIVVTADNNTSYGIPYITEITSQDIELKNAQTVEEALNFIPGVRSTVGSKNEPYITVRGFNQDKVLILLDGIPIASPYYGYVDLNQIPVESIAKIKVIKSCVSPLYGANTLGGVINIVTKKPGKEPHIELSNGFSDRSTRYHLLTTGMKTEDLSLWFSGSHRESDGFDLSKDFNAQRNETGGLRENSYYKKDAFSLKIGLERLENHNPSILFNYIDNEKGIPPDVYSTNPKYRRFTEWKRWMIALVDQYVLTDNFFLKGRVYYDKYDNTLKQYDDDTYTTQAASGWTSIYDEYSCGGSLYLNFIPNEAHFLKSSINFKKDSHKEQDDIGDSWELYEIHTYSFGLEDTVQINKKLSLVFGLSYDVFDQIKTYGMQKGDCVDTVNPVFVLNYFFNEKTSVHASVARRTRFPTLHELYSNTSGNPDLREQTNINSEVGVRFEPYPTTVFILSCFNNNVKNLIDRASKNDQFLNTHKAVLKGFETNINQEIGELFSARIGYTYLDAFDRDPMLLGRSEEELSYVPKHKVDIELNASTDFGLQATILGSYHGKRHHYDTSNVQHSMGGYFVWNTKVSQKFLKHWKVSISIENIFDRNYQEEEGYPLPGRTFLFSVKAMF